jgi:hypothetical protein
MLFDDIDLSAIAPGLDRGLTFEGDEEKKESSKLTKDTVFSIEDMMMSGSDSTFDFLNIKVAPVDPVAVELSEKDDAEDTKGIKKQSFMCKWSMLIFFFFFFFFFIKIPRKWMRYYLLLCHLKRTLCLRNSLQLPMKHSNVANGLMKSMSMNLLITFMTLYPRWLCRYVYIYIYIKRLNQT